MVGQRIRMDKGVTLIELMIVMIICAILVVGIYSLFINQQRSYAIQDQIAGIQQDARAALTIMTRDIRLAGLLTGSEGFNVNGFNFAINPINNSNSSDSITVVFAAEVVSTVANVSSNQVTLQSGGTRFDTSQRRFVAFEGVNHVYEITSLSGDTLTLNESLPSYLDDFGAKVFLVKALTYSVQNNTLILNENTGEGPHDMAGGGSFPILEDLQLAYRVNEDTNWYNALPSDKTNADIRMVRINILVRTPIEDSKDSNYTRPTLEDHVASGPADGFRRRVYTSVVKVRNLRN